MDLTPFPNKPQQFVYEVTIATGGTYVPYQFPAHDALHVLRSPDVVTILPDQGSKMKLCQGLGYENRFNVAGSGKITCDTAGTIIIVISVGGPRIVGLSSPGLVSPTSPAPSMSLEGRYDNITAIPNINAVKPFLGGAVGAMANGNRFAFPHFTRANGNGYVVNGELLSVAPTSVRFGDSTVINSWDGIEEATFGARHLVLEMDDAATGDGSIEVYGSIATGVPTITPFILFAFGRDGLRLLNDTVPTIPGFYYIALHGAEYFKVVVTAPDSNASAIMRIRARYDSIVDTEGF